MKGIDDGSVFAIGDCSCIESHPYPCTAQVAEREGTYLAKALSLYSQGQDGEVQPYSWQNMGMLAYLGGYQGVSDLPQGKLQGFKSWLLWRSVYFTKLGSWRLRFQVPFDWMRTFIWGRDVSQFWASRHLSINVHYLSYCRVRVQSASLLKLVYNFIT